MKKKRIMVVDDEEDIRYVLKRFLEEEEYEVIEAKGGPQCLEMIQKEKPDLIILDILMPGMSGWEVSRKIKEDESFQDIPISMLSILSDSSDAHKSLSYALADRHLRKPIDFPELAKTIRSLLEEYAKRPKGPLGPGAPPAGEPPEFFKPIDFGNS